MCLQVGAAATQQVADPYANEPKRHPALVVRSQQPFNAETPVDVLGTSRLTPNELFYVRNHLPVPHVDPASWSVSLTDAHQFCILPASIVHQHLGVDAIALHMGPHYND